MSRSRMPAWDKVALGVVGGLAVLFVVPTAYKLALIPDKDHSQSVAAWIQAIGSVLALLGVWFSVELQHRRNRELAAESHRELLRQELDVVDRDLREIHHFLEGAITRLDTAGDQVSIAVDASIAANDLLLARLMASPNHRFHGQAAAQVSWQGIKVAHEVRLILGVIRSDFDAARKQATLLQTLRDRQEFVQRDIQAFLDRRWHEIRNTLQQRQLQLEGLIVALADVQP